MPQIPTPKIHLNKYRILFEDSAGTGHYRDIESNSLAHAIWELSQELAYDLGQRGKLIDTMALPDKGNSYQSPTHVNLYPSIQVEQ